MQINVGSFHSSRETADNLGFFSGSSVHIAKLMMNLVTNATEAFEGQGEVRIDTANVPFQPPTSIPKVVLRGSDNGPGIKKEDLERIFEPFYSKKVMGRSGRGFGLRWDGMLSRNMAALSSWKAIPPERPLKYSFRQVLKKILPCSCLT